MRASIIIPTFNKLPRLKLMLASLRAQTLPDEKFEVIIVDDGSTDSTQEYLKTLEEPFQLKYVCTSNRGRSAARNKGLELAMNEYIIFIDDDMLLNKEFIIKHLDLQKEEQRAIHGKISNLTYLKFFEDPTKGIFYPSLKKGRLLPDEIKRKCISESDVAERFDDIIRGNCKTTFLENAIKKIIAANLKDLFLICCTGGNFSCPKRWIELAGGFDEKFGLKWGGEDFELGFRLQERGYPFCYSNEAENYHIVHYRQAFEDELFASFEYFYEKHKNNNILLVRDFLSGKLKSENLLHIIENSQRPNERN